MIGLQIEKLLQYAVKTGLIEPTDNVQMRNTLLDFFGQTAPYEGAIPETGESGTDIIESLYAYAAESGLAADAEAFSARLMGLLTPRQSQVEQMFAARYAESPQTATDWFYAFSQATDYIRTAEIAKNLYWRVPTVYGELELTINLSKPEKDPKQIALERNTPHTGYPKCLLCAENIGFAGNPRHPARQNHRIIPLELMGGTWYLQYSPYVYYNEHCIVLTSEHTPMKLSHETFTRLFAFVGQFPHYFIGSNADLPIVGGSILAHEHFQGGRHAFPMELAPLERRETLGTWFAHDDYPGVDAGVIQWPMSAIRLRGEDAASVVALAAHVYEAWKAYSDEAAGVFAFTEGTGPDASAPEPHNTVTPIARRRDGKYEMDVVLRNNRVSAEHPLGIFHPHADVHHIKKENIGLIEVMGLAILPGRLQEELDRIARVLCGDAAADHPSLEKHAAWIAELTAAYGRRLLPDAAAELLRREVGNKFTRVLADAGVFKRNEAGAAQFDRFLVSAGFRAFS